MYLKVIDKRMGGFEVRGLGEDPFDVGSFGVGELLWTEGFCPTGSTGTKQESSNANWESRNNCQMRFLSSKSD